MIILGIDPGLQKTGWGIIEKNGSRLSYIASGLIKTESTQDLPRRLAALHIGVIDILKRHTPDAAVVEEIFLNKNPSSTIKLVHARGVLIAAIASQHIHVAEYATNKIKKSVVGVGHANKDQIGMMIKTLLPTCGHPSEDEADALAAAITHAHYSNMNKQLLEIAG